MQELQQRLGISEHGCKPYSEMTDEEKRAYSQRRCDWENNRAGQLHEKDGYDCPLCLNRGYIYVVQEVRRGTVNHYSEAIKDCKCKSVRRSLKRLKESGLAKVVEKYTFDAYTTGEAWQAHIKETAINFTKENCGVFYIGGQSGCGKTHICTAIAKEFMTQGKAAYYMLWQDEVIKLKAAVMDEIEYQGMMKRLKNVDVLYIDDFFKPVGDNPKPSAADIRIAYELINYRYNEGKGVTVISSERYIQEILDIDEATGGRIIEYAGPYMLNIQRDRKRNYRLKNI